VQGIKIRDSIKYESRCGVKIFTNQRGQAVFLPISVNLQAFADQGENFQATMGLHW